MDKYIPGVGADLRGYNPFSYCFNNPINMCDNDGNWPGFIKQAIKTVARTIIRPIVKKVQNYLSKINCTYSIGINVSGTPSAFSFNSQVGVSVDTKGNVAVQRSISGGVTGGTPSLSATIYESRSNAPSVQNLTGPGYQVGGSAATIIGGFPLATGADFNFIPDEENSKIYFGTTTNVGVGFPGVEFHVEWGETTNVYYNEFNIFKSLDHAYIKILEW